MEDVLKVKNLTKKYGDFLAVNNISFSLGESEILGLLGVNGAGKTTTLQMLLAVLTPTSGKIEYFGENLYTHREKILEQVNFSSTYTNLPWNLTVKECLTYMSYLYTIKDRKQRIEKISSIFKIEHLLNKQIRHLSAGQCTLVNLSKSFINFPKIILLDEPTASLDPEIAVLIREILLKESKEFNTSIVITSHNMSEVEEICDRVVFIDKGGIVANDTPVNLAKSIQIAHIELLVTEGIKETIELCEKQSLPFKTEKKRIKIDIKEKNIAGFLNDLAKKKIVYQEISIEKPSLEDYFIEMTNRSKNYETA